MKWIINKTMGSRIREKVEHFFEVFVEIGRPSKEKQDTPEIMRYPLDYNDEVTLKMIPQFAYPCQTEASQVDHFTFVLTDLESTFRFGYCRHTTGHQTCLCIISWLPWCEIFYKMLDRLAEMKNRSVKNNVTSFLHAVYNQKIPPPCSSVTIVANEDMFPIKVPDPDVLPSIPSSRNLTEYYNAVDPYNMMVIFASMLHERRIYMTSKKLSRLTACIHAAEALLYPMHWQHLYIPVLPESLLDYISAPMPFLIGIHSNLVKKLHQNRVEVGDAVVVDLDVNTVSSQYDDLGDLPEDVSSYLKKNLKMDVVKNSMMKNGDAISVAFLQTLVRLIGGYRDALKFRPGEPITFDPEAFVRSRPSQTTQAFLEGMLTLQIFQQFIYGRLQILNSGAGFRDIFEQQATLYADKLNSQSTYKEWLKSAKKSGKKGWNGLKVKMKEHGKKAAADIKSRLSVLTEKDDKKIKVQQSSKVVTYTKVSRKDLVSSTSESSRPIRPTRPPPPSRITQQEYEKRHKTSEAKARLEAQGDNLNYQRVDVNLMSDRDIQEAMLKSSGSDLLWKAQTCDDDSEDDSSDPEQLSMESKQMPDYTSALHPVIAPRKNLDFEGARNRHLNVSAKSLSLQGSSSHPELPVSNVAKGKLQRMHKSESVQDTHLSDLEETDQSKCAAPFRSFDKPFNTLPRNRLSGSQVESQEDVDDVDLRSIHRNLASRVSLTRCQAFRREAHATPLRTQHLDDDVDDFEGQKDCLVPLNPSSSLSHEGVVSKNVETASVLPSRHIPLHSQSVHFSSHNSMRESSDLLKQEWSLATLAKGPCINLPLTPQLARSSPVKLTAHNTSVLEESATTTASSSKGNSHTDQQFNRHRLGARREAVGQNNQESSRVNTAQFPQSSKTSALSHFKAPPKNTHNALLSKTLPRIPGALNFSPPIQSSSTPVMNGRAGKTQTLRPNVVNSSISSSLSSSDSSLHHHSISGTDPQSSEFKSSNSLGQALAAHVPDINSNISQPQVRQSNWKHS